MMVLITIAALVFFGWTVYGALRAVTEVYDEAVGNTLRFNDADLLELVAEKRAALGAIKASELDFETGKVSEADYEEVKSGVMAEAIELMRRLDDVRESFEYDRRIERDLVGLDAAMTRRKTRYVKADRPDDLLIGSDEPTDPVGGGLSVAARLRQRRRDVSAPEQADKTTCSSCGSDLDEDDKFCDQCGQAVEINCTACGASLRKGAKFCNECGQRTTFAREAE